MIFSFDCQPFPCNRCLNGDPLITIASQAYTHTHVHKSGRRKETNPLIWGCTRVSLAIHKGKNAVIIDGFCFVFLRVAQHAYTPRVTHWVPAVILNLMRLLLHFCSSFFAPVCCWFLIQFEQGVDPNWYREFPLLFNGQAILNQVHLILKY